MTYSECDIRYSYIRIPILRPFTVFLNIEPLPSLLNHYLFYLNQLKRKAMEINVIKGNNYSLGEYAKCHTVLKVNMGRPTE